VIGHRVGQDYLPRIKNQDSRARTSRAGKLARLMALGAAVALMATACAVTADRVLAELERPYEGVSEPAVWPEDDPCYDPATKRVLPPVYGDDC
jgi:hypothetical protein